VPWYRAAAAAALLLAGLGVAAATTRSTSSTRTAPLAIDCSASALSAPYTGPLKVRSVDSFGCEGRFAYLWATVGRGVEEIGVTEVLRYDTRTHAWENALRSTYCTDHRLPTYVERWGCNSN
jgi:hypothetical protein